jgi:hypothetical protein
LAAVLTLAACGSGARQDAQEPNGNFKVDVSSTFPTTQRLAEPSHFVVTIRNVDNRTIPDIAVTICNVSCSYAATTKPNAGEGTSVQAFSGRLAYPTGQLASDSRPVWIIDQAPGACKYSCQQGGPGGAVTAYSNTWAMGSLKPNHSVTFDWKVTAVKAGTHVVAWQVAAGLNGKAKAETTGGVQPKGTFKVDVKQAPQQAYVNNAGQVVNTP